MHVLYLTVVCLFVCLFCCAQPSHRAAGAAPLVHLLQRLQSGPEHSCLCGWRAWLCAEDLQRGVRHASVKGFALSLEEPDSD